MQWGGIYQILFLFQFKRSYFDVGKYSEVRVINGGYDDFGGLQQIVWYPWRNDTTIMRFVKLIYRIYQYHNCFPLQDEET